MKIVLLVRLAFLKEKPAISGSITTTFTKKLQVLCFLEDWPIASKIYTEQLLFSFLPF